MRHAQISPGHIAHIQLLGGERSATDSSGIRLDHTNRRPDQLWRDSQTGANSSDSRRRRSDVRVRPKIYIQHQRVGTFDEDALSCAQSRVDISDTVDNERFQPRRQLLDREKNLVSPRGQRTARGVCGTDLVSKYFPFSIVLEMSISFVSSLNQLAEFFRKGFVIKEVVNPKPRPGGLSRVRRTDTSLRSSNAAHKTAQMSPPRQEKEKKNGSIPRSTKLNLFEPIHDLVKIKNELRSVRDEQSVRAI